MEETQEVTMMTKTLGILDISPQNITEPPNFTEQATIEAMNNLEIVPNDLVPHDIKNQEISNENSQMCLQITLELEKQRLLSIEKIINERNRLLSQAEPDIQGLHKKINKSTPRRKKKRSTIPKLRKKKLSNKQYEEDEAKRKFSSKRSKQKIINNNNSKVRIPEVKSKNAYRVSNTSNSAPSVIPIFKPKKLKIQIKEDLIERQNRQSEENEKDKMSKLLIIRKGAMERMHQVMEEQRIMKLKKEQKMKEQLAESQRKEKQYMKLQEKKRKEFEKKRRLRNKKLYGNSIIDKKENHFAELRKKIIQSQVCSVNNSRSPSPTNENRDKNEFFDSIIISSEEFVISKDENSPHPAKIDRRSKIPMFRKNKKL